MNQEQKPESEQKVMFHFLHLAYLNLSNTVPFHEGQGTQL